MQMASLLDIEQLGMQAPWTLAELVRIQPDVWHRIDLACSVLPAPLPGPTLSPRGF